MTSSSSADAIRILFEENAGVIYGLGLRTCRSPEEAEDLVQETFMRAFKAWEGFEGRASPKTWLYTIAVRACQRMHRLRSGEPREMESIEELLPSKERNIVDIPVDENGALDAMVREEVRDTVDRAISLLPINFRVTLVLKDIAGLTVAETAEVLDIKGATVKTRVHRARMLLRKVIAENLPQREAGEDAGHGGPGHVCIDLLYAKQEALDKGVDFPVDDGELCERCRSVFATLDIALGACQEIRHGRYPESLRSIIDRLRSDLSH
jgi:RNA polymerase sigma-70 factor (ECF subfamily)